MAIRYLSGRDLREHIQAHGIDYSEAIDRIRHAGLTMEDVKFIAEKAIESPPITTPFMENIHAH